MLNHSGNPQLAVAGMTEGAPHPCRGHVPAKRCSLLCIMAAEREREKEKRERERVIPRKNRDPRGEVGEVCNGKDTWENTWGDSCLILVRCIDKPG